MTKSSERLLIRGATVLEPDTPLRRADIRIENGRICELAPRLHGKGEGELDASGCLAMAGLVNAHTHSGQSLDRGTALNMPLDLWMVWSIYAAAVPSPEDAYTTAACGALEMIATGTTSVLDQVFLPVEEFEAHAQAVVAAYEDLGIRAAVAPMVQDRDFLESLQVEQEMSGQKPGLSPNYAPKLLLDKLTRFVDDLDRRTGTVTAMLGPTAPQRCSDEFFSLVSDLARRRGLRVHTHLLEAKTQRIACQRRWGCSAVDHLDKDVDLTSRASFAHGVWVTPAEHRLIAARGNVVVHNPVSNMRLGSGVFPLQYLLALGVPVALGSDGAASNDNQDMFEVLKVASMLSTLYGDFRRWAQPEATLRACQLSGALALGQPVGRLAPGAPADVVLLRLDPVPFTATHAVASLVNGGVAGCVESVVVAGRTVLDHGAPAFAGAASLQERAARYMERSAARLDERQRMQGEYGELISNAIDAADIDPMEPVRWWQQQ